MKNRFGLKKEEINKIVGVIKLLLPESKIWLFGSRARGDYNENSDIDIAIEYPNKLTISQLREVEDVLKSLNIFHKIDLIEFNQINDDNFRNEILKDRVLWEN